MLGVGRLCQPDMASQVAGPIDGVKSQADQADAVLGAAFPSCLSLERRTELTQFGGEFSDISPGRVGLSNCGPRAHQRLALQLKQVLIDVDNAESNLLDWIAYHEFKPRELPPTAVRLTNR